MSTKAINDPDATNLIDSKPLTFDDILNNSVKADLKPKTEESKNSMNSIEYTFIMIIK